MIRIATTLAAILLPAFAAGEQLRSVTAGVDTAAEPTDAIRAFLDAAELRGWWKVSRSLVEPEVGGVWSVSWDDWGAEKTQHAWNGVIRELTPTRLVIGPLVMNEPDRPLFGPLELEIAATAIDGGSRVTVRHGGYQSGPDWDWMHDTVVAGWGHVLGDLADWLARPVD